MTNALPKSVLYVKNGTGGKWWKVAKEKKELHAGWRELPSELIRNFDSTTIREQYYRHYPDGLTQDFNALVRLLDRPSRHIWVTFEEGYLWWCSVRDGADADDKDEESRGHFWLHCDRPWSNHSLKGRLLTIPDLPGRVTTVSGFRATVAKPEAWQDILRVICDELDKKVAEAQYARLKYEQSVKELIAGLSWKDFEHLIDLILLRGGWERISVLGKTLEGIDLDVENPAINERAFVQVKSKAGQAELDDYLKRFNERRETYKRIIFAVHTPNGELTPPADLPVQVWTNERIAQLVVRLGLGEKVEKMQG